MRAAARPPDRLGPYELVGRLGSGGMAEVHEAVRAGAHGFEKRVAIKLMLPHLADDPRLVGMFCDEARVHARLTHPNLIQVLDFGEHEGRLYLVLELVDGLSLQELGFRLRSTGRKMDLGAVLYVAQEILGALEYAHSACDESARPLHLVHRDVSPSNVLIGSAGQVKLGDFGIACATEIDARTAPGEIKGKIGYVSPEQALGSRLDGRSDLFSLGVVLAEMLLGHSLFEAESDLATLEMLHSGDLSRLEAAKDRIPEDVMLVLLRALKPLPAQRFDSASHMLWAVRELSRRHRNVMTAYSFAAWLGDEGIVPIKSDVFMRPAPSIADALRAAAWDDEGSEAITLVAGSPSVPPTELDHALVGSRRR
ncbi:MAG: serine/threonine-protein kinase [Polyangiaceae bacterium]